MDERRIEQIASKITNEKARANWLSFMQSVEADEPSWDAEEVRSDDADGVEAIDAVDLKELNLKRFEKVESIVNPFPIEERIEIPSGINALKNDMTQLMDAVMDRDIEMVRDVLSRGADPMTRNNSHHTAADIARRLGYDEILAVLESAAPSMIA